LRAGYFPLYNQVKHKKTSMTKFEEMNKETDIGLCKEIARGVYCMEVGKGISRSNVYFVQSKSSWVLIDAASANCGRLIRSTAEALFGANTQADSILLTHDHPDHAGSALELARLWGCPVYMHPDELPLAIAEELSVMERYANPLDRWIILPLLHAMPRQRVKSMLLKQSLKDVARALDPGDAVPNLPGWKWIPSPGHTPGHIAFFRTGDGTLITGDAVITADLNSFSGILSWCLRTQKQTISGPPLYSTRNKREAKESVTALAALDPRVLASGHGVPMEGDEVAGGLHALAERLGAQDSPSE
jgi:glyoxylase-like metal-dependent hydrolase (beta-lactamase superfamily II)